MYMDLFALKTYHITIMDLLAAHRADFSIDSDFFIFDRMLGIGSLINKTCSFQKLPKFDVILT